MSISLATKGVICNAVNDQTTFPINVDLASDAFDTVSDPTENPVEVASDSIDVVSSESSGLVIDDFSASTISADWVAIVDSLDLDAVQANGVLRFDVTGSPSILQGLYLKRLSLASSGSHDYRISTVRETIGNLTGLFVIIGFVDSTNRVVFLSHATTGVGTNEIRAYRRADLNYDPLSPWTQIGPSISIGGEPPPPVFFRIQINASKTSFIADYRTSESSSWTNVVTVDVSSHISGTVTPFIAYVADPTNGAAVTFDNFIQGDIVEFSAFIEVDSDSFDVTVTSGT